MARLDDFFTDEQVIVVNSLLSKAPQYDALTDKGLGSRPAMVSKHSFPCDPVVFVMCKLLREFHNVAMSQFIDTAPAKGFQVNKALLYRLENLKEFPSSKTFSCYVAFYCQMFDFPVAGLVAAMNWYFVPGTAWESVRELLINLDEKQQTVAHTFINWLWAMENARLALGLPTDILNATPTAKEE